MKRLLDNEVTKDYGCLKAGTKIEIPEGYTVFTGRNNQGKTTLLNYIFKCLYEKTENKSSFIYIPNIRQFSNDRVNASDPNRLVEHNHELYKRTVVAPGDIGDTFRNLVPHVSAGIGNKALIDRLSNMTELFLEEHYDQQENIHQIGGKNLGNNGDGIRALFPILVALVNPGVTTVLIDEPEACLEAGSTRLLKKYLIEAVQEGKNVICTTHNPIFFNHEEFENNLLISKVRDVIVIEPVDKGKYENLVYTRLGVMLSDVGLPDNYLFVEGWSDQVIMSQIIRLKEMEVPSDKKIAVISLKGKDNAPITLDCLTKNLIGFITKQSPYRDRVVLLLDRLDGKDPIKADPFIKTMQRDSRFFELSADCLEESLSEALFKKAGLNKASELEELKEKKSKPEQDAIKKRISNAIASGIDVDSLADATLKPFVEAYEAAIR